MTGWDKERQGTIPEAHAQRMGVGLSGHHLHKLGPGECFVLLELSPHKVEESQQKALGTKEQ